MACLMEILKIYLEKEYSEKACHKSFNIAKNLKHDGYQRGLASMVYKFFGKKSSGGAVKSEFYTKPTISRRIVQNNYQKI